MNKLLSAKCKNSSGDVFKKGKYYNYYINEGNAYIFIGENGMGYAFGDVSFDITFMNLKELRDEKLNSLIND